MNNNDYKKILDNLVDNEDYRVRAAVAEQGYGLDKLVDDEVYYVRTAVAEQGYGLDKLINDEVYYVRIVVAKQGYGLDKLINDEDTLVRRTVVLDEMKNKYLNMKNALNDNDMDTLETIYPVGSIYTSIDNSLPDFIKNLGTWEPVLAGYPITNGSIITDVIPVNTTGYMWKRTS